MKTVFFGTSEYVFPLLDVLREKTQLTLVITTDKLPTDSVPLYCKKNNIPCVIVSTKGELLQQEFSANLGVLAYFGLILPSSFLKKFPKGILNTHPSLLPKYRGPTPVQTALLNGDTETGTSLILLDNEMDHGPVLVSEKEKIKDDDTLTSLHKRLFSLGARLLSESLDNYISGTIKPIPQDHKKATYTKKLTRDSGYFDIDSPPTFEEFDRMIRAYNPWPGVWTKVRIKNKELRIKFLLNKRIQIEGKKPVDTETFKRGYPETSSLIDSVLV